jgi:hypothetical protein
MDLKETISINGFTVYLYDKLSIGIWNSLIIHQDAGDSNDPVQEDVELKKGDEIKLDKGGQTIRGTISEISTRFFLTPLKDARISLVTPDNNIISFRLSDTDIGSIRRILLEGGKRRKSKRKSKRKSQRKTQRKIKRTRK